MLYITLVLTYTINKVQNAPPSHWQHWFDNFHIVQQLSDHVHRPICTRDGSWKSRGKHAIRNIFSGLSILTNHTYYWHNLFSSSYSPMVKSLKTSILSLARNSYSRFKLVKSMSREDGKHIPRKSFLATHPSSRNFQTFTILYEVPNSPLSPNSLSYNRDETYFLLIFHTCCISGY